MMSKKQDEVFKDLNEKINRVLDPHGYGPKLRDDLLKELHRMEGLAPQDDGYYLAINEIRDWANGQSV